MPAPGSTSLIDAVDDANRPVGTVPRGDVFAVGSNFRTVHVLVLNAAGQVLLQRLGARRDRHPLAWGSSVAGYLHAGEEYAAAAARRLYEELAQKTPLRQVGVAAMPDNGVTKFIGVFTTVADTPRIADAEHIEEIAFWSLSDIDRELRSQPTQFTASFRHVLDFWRHHHQQGADRAPS